MKRLQTILAKTVLLAAAGLGLSACVGVVPQPAYYQAPAYYSYQPEYYAPPPAYGTFFYYQSSGRSDRHHRGHGSRHYR